MRVWLASDAGGAVCLGKCGDASRQPDSHAGEGLECLARLDVGNNLSSIAVNLLKRRPGFFFCAGLELGKLKTTLAVEFVLDNVLGGFHDISCQLRLWVSGLAEF